MSSSVLIVVFIVWLGLSGFIFWFVRKAFVDRTISRRLSETFRDKENVTAGERSWLAWWLYRAGFRSALAVPWFLIAMGASTLAGTLLIVAVYQLQVVDLWVNLLASIPGNVGEVFLPLAWGGPWLCGGLMAAVPVLVIMSRRERRIREVEQDLPLMLDLLATLAEAGIGFDAALEKVLQSDSKKRTLAVEFQAFQLDVLAGRTRIQALRQLMKRVDVAWFSIFVSAVIQAEQMGSGLAQTLKIQADDLRNRRRERALAFAMAIPVKLLLPLIVCFLPGVMVAAVGPTAYQLVMMLEGVLQGAGLRPV